MCNLRMVCSMEAIFFETSFFTATVSDYLSDEEYKELQQELLKILSAAM